MAEMIIELKTGKLAHVWYAKDESSVFTDVEVTQPEMDEIAETIRSTNIQLERSFRRVVA